MNSSESTWTEGHRGHRVHSLVHKVFQFEGHELDVTRGCLWSGQREVPLRPKSFAVLCFLIENANRLVSKAEIFKVVWPDVFVTDDSLTQCIREVRIALRDRGRRIIKTVPRRGYLFDARISDSEIETSRVEVASTSSPLPPASLPSDLSRSAFASQPSIAVLPFQNLSRDPDLEYFADGIVEDITTALSRMRWLFVTARNSSFIYKGRQVDVAQVAQHLGVRYVLEGSVRKAGDRLRIAGQLIDATTRMHLWADHFDGTSDDVFDLQDQVTASVVGAIAPKLERAEIERAVRRPTQSLDAYDNFLRGIASAHKMVIEANYDANVEALRLFCRATELDPGFGSAFGRAAHCYAVRKLNGWMADRVQETIETARLAERAASSGWDDAAALCDGGFARAYVLHDLDAGAALIKRAITLNPNLAYAWQCSGLVNIYLGKPVLAIKQLAHAMRLSPCDPLVLGMQASIASAHFFAGHYELAASLATGVQQEWPKASLASRVAAASHALAGRLKEARNAMAILRQSNPALRISNLDDAIPLRRPHDLARLTQGLREAGLPP